MPSKHTRRKTKIATEEVKGVLQTRYAREGVKGVKELSLALLAEELRRYHQDELFLGKLKKLKKLKELKTIVSRTVNCPLGARDASRLKNCPLGACDASRLKNCQLSARRLRRFTPEELSTVN